MNGKVLVGLSLIAISLFVFSNNVFATPGAVEASYGINDIPLDEIKEFWENINNQYGGFLPESEKGSLVDMVSGKTDATLMEWINGIVKFVFHELVANGRLLGTLIFLTIFSMFLQTLQSSFEKTSVSKIAYAIVYMVLIIIALNSFHIAITYVKQTIDTITDFLMALIPLLLALIASSGGALSAAFFHPVLLFLMNTSGVLVEYVVLPLLFLSALLSIVSTLTDQYKATYLAGLLRTWSIGLLGIYMTIFMAVISVQGVTTAVADGIGLRTAKFITGNFIPVIGRLFTDAADTVISASVLLKNTVGVAGLVIVLVTVTFPALKILILSFIYKAAAAILQPLGGGPIIKCLDIISKNILYIFASLAIVSLMFFLAITVIVTAGNVTLMVR